MKFWLLLCVYLYFKKGIHGDQKNSQVKKKKQEKKLILYINSNQDYNGHQRFMVILERACLCQSPAFLPHCFMYSCAGQRPHSKLLINGNRRNLYICWKCYLSMSSMLYSISVSQALYLTLPSCLQAQAALSPCLLSCLFSFYTLK